MATEGSASGACGNSYWALPAAPSYSSGKRARSSQSSTEPCKTSTGMAAVHKAMGTWLPAGRTEIVGSGRSAGVGSRRSAGASDKLMGTICELGTAGEPPATVLVASTSGSRSGRQGMGPPRAATLRVSCCEPGTEGQEVSRTSPPELPVPSTNGRFHSLAHEVAMEDAAVVALARPSCLRRSGLALPASRENAAEGVASGTVRIPRGESAQWQWSHRLLDSRGCKNG